MHDFPYVLISLLAIFHLIFAISIIKRRPCDNKLDNYRYLVQEMCFFVGTVGLLWLVK